MNKPVYVVGGLTEKPFEPNRRSKQEVKDYDYFVEVKDYAEAGYVEYFAKLSSLYFNGYSCHKNPSLAVYWGLKAYEEGQEYYNLYSNLAECFYSGYGVQKDLENALIFYKLDYPNNLTGRKLIIERIDGILATNPQLRKQKSTSSKQTINIKHFLELVTTEIRRKTNVVAYIALSSTDTCKTYPPEDSTVEICIRVEPSSSDRFEFRSLAQRSASYNVDMYKNAQEFDSNQRKYFSTSAWMRDDAQFAGQIKSYQANKSSIEYNNAKAVYKAIAVNLCNEIFQKYNIVAMGEVDALSKGLFGGTKVKTVKQECPVRRWKMKFKFPESYRN